MKKEKLYILIALIIFLITSLTSISSANFIDNILKEKGGSEYLGNIFMIGRIFNKKFNGGYVGSYSFKIKCVYTFNDQEPKVQWIKNKVCWVCNRDYYGHIGNFLIFAKGDFYLID